MAISFHLRSELDILMHSVKVMNKFSQLAGSMWLDVECVSLRSGTSRGIYVSPSPEPFLQSTP
jgi:hypothetical protein